MVSNKHPATPVEESSQSQAGIGRALVVPAWQPEGPTLRFKELLKVVRVSRSKAYELMKSDPDFPKGIPLYDSEQSPKFYWTHEAMAWVEARSNKFRNQQKGN
jgi:predicted DNA-binding transcriptional regulator AlpA